MLRPHLVFPLALLLASSALFAQAPATPAAPPAATPAATPFPLPPQKADVASPKMDRMTGQPITGFLAQHRSFLAIAKAGKAQLVFLGDSITAGWGSAKPVWDKAFGEWQPANFGIGGDQTQHVLWRIENGELDGIKPKVVVLMIGTNNSKNDSAPEIASGITKIVATIRQKQPAAKILLLAVFPRGPKAENNDRRVKLAEVNETISKLDDGKSVFYLDIGEKFLLPDKSFNPELTKDFLHLTPPGYQIWADAITPKLTELMK